MRTVIVGLGEIGTALASVLEQYKPELVDPARGLSTLSVNCDILHVCFPYSEDFIEQVEEYKLQHTPKYTVVHSTVPPGTCAELGAVHSPVIGLHPFLEKGLRTFTKYLAGEQASEVADYFRKAGLKVYLFDNPETTELLKVLDTSFYALCIEYTKEVKRLCEEYDVPFEAWSIYTDNYNTGYQKLGYPEYTRPNLVPIMKPQGGHCTTNNLELLRTDFTDFIKKQNNK